MTGRIVETLLGLVVGLSLVVWFMVWTVRRAEEPVQMIIKWVITLPVAALCLLSVSLFGPFGPFVIVGCAVVLSILWTPHLGAVLVKPLTSALDGGNQPPEPRPLYSMARASQKRGKYTEAVAQIRGQLALFPTDFEGQMLLAEIQAENLQDLQGAELAVQRFCSQPNHAASNIAFALNSLADWHLKFGCDPEAARRALDQISTLLPDTEFSLVAAQRLAHLGNPEMFLGHDYKKFTVREGSQRLGLVQAVADARPPETDPVQLVADYVKHLEQHPLDFEIRERLAILYVDHYKRLDLAADQLEQLIQQPKAPHKSVVHWLNRMADLQIRSGSDYESIKRTLERVIALAPNLAAAETARRRIELLRLEQKALGTNEAVKLGTYEQNIGLKHGRPGGV